MTEPIISPWLIYFLGISEQVSSVGCKLFCATGIIGAIVFGLITLTLLEEQEKGWKWTASFVPPSLLLAFIGIAFGTLIPDREWIIATALAGETTPENVETVVHSAEDAYSFVKGEFIELIKELSEPEEE